MKTRKIFLTICLLGIFPVTAFAQSKTISGVVSDSIGPVPGANVVVKGTVRGTATGLDGKYSISVNIGETLVFSSAGLQSQEVKITKRTKSILNITLKAEVITKLDEIVIVGYGVQKKPDMTGSTISISEGKSRRKKEKQAIYQAMQGRAAGVQVTTVQGSPGYGNQYETNNEEYSNYSENRFLQAINEPLSTFSLDVDAASYSNMRRIVNQGQLPSKDAVRVEELVNYFSYDYQQPTDGHPVKITTETAACPWNEKHKLVRIGVKAKEIPSEKLPAANFVFLIDVSGSMYGPTRLELVKSSLKLLVNNLRDKDRVAIVVYAGAAGEVLPSTAGTDRQKIIEAIQNLTAGGSTAGGAGW